MFAYKFIQSANFKINTDIVDDIFDTVYNNISIPQNGIVNIVFVSPEKIQELNKSYRGKDAVTDVLSFHYHEDFLDLGDEDIAGELIFCEERIIFQGKEYDLGTEKEFYKLLIHSLLHILGYDHETDEEYREMEKCEKVIWKNIF